MITLAENCLVFELPGGESIPYSPEMLSVELLGNAAGTFDQEFVLQAAQAVFHYFKQDLNRERVSAMEFAETLENVLRGFKLEEPAPAVPEQTESDLKRLASESGTGCELFFFSRLREELRQQLLQQPRVLRFHGLRGCVKHLAGSTRWTARCRSLEERIVDFLRECVGAEARKSEFALVVE